MDDPSSYGLVRLGGGGAVREFVEKPSPEEGGTHLVNAGAYILERGVLDGLAPAGTKISIEREVFPTLVDNGLYGYEAAGYWLDIGTPERYLQATFEILEGDVRTEVGRQVAAAGGVLRHGGDGAGIVHGPALVGADCRLAADAVVGSRSVLGQGVTRGTRGRTSRAPWCSTAPAWARAPGSARRSSGPGRASATAAGSRAGWCSARA